MSADPFQQQDLCQQIIEAALCGMIVIDKQGKILLVNTLIENMFGYTPKELLEMKINQLIPSIYQGAHPEDQQDFYENSKARLMGAGRDLYGLTKDGRELPLEIGLNPIKAEGKMMVLASIVDITERKKYEEQFQQVVESAPNAMVIVDQYGSIHLVNRAMEKLFGYTREELLQMKVDQLVPERFQNAHPQHRDHFHKHPTARAMGAGRDLFGLRKDGSEVPIEIGLNPLETKSGKMVLASIIDISERILLYKKDNEIKKQLEHAVKQQTQDINRQRIAALNIMQDEKLARERVEKVERELLLKANQLVRSNQELEQFAYVASHDLQEPLRMIASYTQLLERRYNDLLDEKGKKYIYFAVDGATRMQQLINDLLSFSRVGTKGKEFIATDLNQVYEKATTNLEIAIKENNAQVLSEQLPVVFGDDVQLIQLFQNLIGNALKFHGETPPKVQIHVEDKEQEWLFCVADNGIGLDEKFKDRIFIIFQRLHTKDEYKGTGIGLAVCKKIVERHGGKIWVESKPGQGAKFFFTLPKERKKKIGEISAEDGSISPQI